MKGEDHETLHLRAQVKHLREQEERYREILKESESQKEGSNAQHMREYIQSGEILSQASLTRQEEMAEFQKTLPLTKIRTLFQVQLFLWIIVIFFLFSILNNLATNMDVLSGKTT